MLLKLIIIQTHKAVLFLFKLFIITQCTAITSMKK